MFQVKRKFYSSSGSSVGRSDSSHFEEGQIKEEIRNSVGKGNCCARASKHLCSVSGSSATATRRAAPPGPAGRNGRKELPVARAPGSGDGGRRGGECLAGPVRSGRIARQWRWKDASRLRGEGMRQECSRLLAPGAHTNATLLCSPSNLLRAVPQVSERAGRRGLSFG